MRLPGLDVLRKYWMIFLMTTQWRCWGFVMNTCGVNNLWDVMPIDSQVNKTANKLSIHYGICKKIVLIFSIFQSELQGRESKRVESWVVAIRSWMYLCWLINSPLLDLWTSSYEIWVVHDNWLKDERYFGVSQLDRLILFYILLVYLLPIGVFGTDSYLIDSKG